MYTADYDILIDSVIIESRICDAIFDNCSVKTLVRLRRTCQTIRSAIDQYFERTFDVNRLLHRFFDDPMSFRHVQAQTGTVISGSTALQFFICSVYPGSDLDIYTPMAWRSTVGHYLLQVGYEFVPNSIQHPNFDVAVDENRVTPATDQYGSMKGVVGVFNFVRQLTNGEVAKVQMVVAVRSTVEVILGYHSSALFIVGIPVDLAEIRLDSCRNERYNSRKGILPLSVCHP